MPAMKTEYEVLQGKTAAEIAGKVELMLERGWQLQGGVSVAIWKDRALYYQAIIRHFDPTDKKRQPRPAGVVTI